MNISFQEKSIWVSLVATILIFGFYFIKAFNVFSSANTPNESLIGLFIAVIVLSIVAQIVLQSVLAIAYRKEAEGSEDERDNIIELKATRISYFVLAIGVWFAGFSIFAIPSSLATANIILFFFLLAEIVGFSTQLFFYRRGV